MNSYYSHTDGIPISQSRATSSTMRNEFDLIGAGFDRVDADIQARAPIASPALTGTPTAPTAVAGDASSQIATTEFVAATAFSPILPGQTGHDNQILSTSGGSARWVNNSGSDLYLATTFGAL